jgi:thioesterase domain-containing protein
VLIDTSVPTGIVDPDHDVHDHVATIARGQGIDVSAGELRAAGLDGAAACVMARAAEAGVLTGIGVEQLQRMIAVYEALGDAVRSYAPRRYARPLTLLRAGDGDGTVPRSRTLGWDAWAERVDVIDIAGRHDDLMDPPALPEVIAAMRAVTAKRRP